MFKSRATPKAVKRKNLVLAVKSDVDCSYIKHEEPCDEDPSVADKYIGGAGSVVPAVDTVEETDGIPTTVSGINYVQNMKKPRRGLVMTNDETYLTACKALVGRPKAKCPSAEAVLVAAEAGKEGLDRYRLLDKTFRTQASRGDQVVDKHFEAYMAKRMGEAHAAAAAANSSNSGAALSSETRLQELQKELFAIPKHLQVENTAEMHKDKMTWVSGLMEVPLPAEVKLKNVEDAERAKQSAQWEVFQRGLHIPFTSTVNAVSQERHQSFSSGRGARM